MMKAGPLFPRWFDRARPLAGFLLVAAPVYAIGLLYYAGSPKTTDLRYQPVQPVTYSHALHAGQLGIDCRYCHNTVDRAAFAAAPPTRTCMNCHERIATKAPALLPVLQSWATGEPIHWIKVNDLPDYVFFDHSAHVTRGVGCVSCHGRVDRMDRVEQVETLSMSWCLRCHRNPEPNLRPVSEVTNMNWRPSEDQATLGARLRKENNINPSDNCSTCHR